MPTDFDCFVFIILLFITLVTARRLLPQIARRTNVQVLFYHVFFLHLGCLLGQLIESLDDVH